MISVIVPVYNAIKYLEQCVESIMEQTYKDIEIILVDDGSTDGSCHLCDSLATRDSRIRVIHQINGGEASARNTGVKAASGEFIGFVDADDWIEPNMYERLLSLLQENNCKIVCCSNTEVYGEKERLFRSRQFVGQTNAVHAIEIILGGQYNPAVWCKLFHREAILDTDGTPILFHNLKCGTDLVWVVEVFVKAQNVVFDDAMLVHYRILEGSASRTINLSQNRLDELLAWAEVVYKTSGLKGKAHDIALSGFYSHYRNVRKIAKNSTTSDDLKRFEEFIKTFSFMVPARNAYVKRRLIALLRKSPFGFLEQRRSLNAQ